MAAAPGAGRGVRGAGGGIAGAPGARSWPRPRPASVGPRPRPRPAPPAEGARRFPAARRSEPLETHLGQVRPARPLGKVMGPGSPAAVQAVKRDPTLPLVQVLVQSEGLEILRPGFESKRGHRVTLQHCPPTRGRSQVMVTPNSSVQSLHLIHRC